MIWRQIFLSWFENVGCQLAIELEIIPQTLNISGLMSRLNEIGLDWWCHILLHKIGKCCQVMFPCIRLHICCLTVVIRRSDSPGWWVKIPLHRVLLVDKISHFWSLLRHRCLCFILMCAHERLQIRVLLVVLLLESLLRNLLLERIDLIKFANSFLIQTIYALECSLSDGFLMVC